MSPPIQLWHIRADGEDFDVNSVYGKKLIIFLYDYFHTFECVSMYLLLIDYYLIM